MTSTIKLPSGKLIDLSRFVALLEDDNSAEKKYQLNLDGLNKSIDLDTNDAEFISQKLDLKLDSHNFYANQHWDKEAQLKKNQPLMKLVKQWQQQKNGKPATEEEIREYQDIQKSLKRIRIPNHLYSKIQKIAIAFNVCVFPLPDTSIATICPLGKASPIPVIAIAQMNTCIFC